MWQAFESSIQTINKARRSNLSFKKRSKNTTSSHQIIRPTCTIAELMRKTSFTKDEIRHLYRTFKQDCPSGEVTKTHFTAIFATLFPSGEYLRYSGFLFRNIDRLNTGIIRFEDLIVTLSILIHGSMEDRISWIFDLYDLDKDGILTRIELFQIVASIYQLIVPVCSKLNLVPITNAIEQRTDELFRNMDTDGNGYVHKQDFVRYCLRNPMIRHSIETLRCNI